MFIKFNVNNTQEVIRKSDIKSFEIPDEGDKAYMRTYHSDKYTLNKQVINDIIIELEEDNNETT